MIFFFVFFFLLLLIVVVFFRVICHEDDVYQLWQMEQHCDGNKITPQERIAMAKLKCATHSVITILFHSHIEISLKPTRRGLCHENIKTKRI